jgi:hypothetical protein
MTRVEHVTAVDDSMDWRNKQRVYERRGEDITKLESIVVRYCDWR